MWSEFGSGSRAGAGGSCFALAAEKTRASFKQGRLSFSKVRAITRVATPANEEVLLNIAFHGTAWHVEKVVSAWRRELRVQAQEMENRRHATRELRWFWDDDGCLVIKGRLTPEQGAIFQQAIESGLQQLSAEQKDVPADMLIRFSSVTTTSCVLVVP